jgi:hypothetical protein
MSVRVYCCWNQSSVRCMRHAVAVNRTLSVSHCVRQVVTCHWGIESIIVPAIRDNGTTSMKQD